MKALGVATMLALFFASQWADAHPRRRVYVRPGPPVWVTPAPIVVMPPVYPGRYVVPPPVVVPMAPPRRVVVAQQAPPKKSRNDMLGIGIRGSGYALEGYKFNLNTFENPVMGGVGLQFRMRFWTFFGLELSTDYMVGMKGDFTQMTIPIMVSGMFYLFPDRAINLYGLAGMGVSFTELEYGDGAIRGWLTEIPMQLGLGVQIWLGDHIALHADLRFLTIYKNLDSASEIVDACSRHRGVCSPQQVNLDDRYNVGLQFGAGVSFYF